MSSGSRAEMSESWPDATGFVERFGNDENNGEETITWKKSRETPQEESTDEIIRSTAAAVDADTVPPAERNSSQPWVLLIASLANLGISFNVVNIDLAIKIMRDIYDEDAGDESLVKAAAIFGMMAGQVIFGTLGDVVGRQLALCYTLLVCFLGAVGSALIFGAGIFHQLLVWRIMLGIGAGGVYPLAATLARASGVRLFAPKENGGNSGYDEEDAGGTAVAIMFSMQGVGHLAARVTGYVLVFLLPNNMEMAWRLLLGLGAVLPFALVVAIFSSFATKSQNDITRNGGGEEGQRDAPQGGGATDGPHATSFVRTWMALPDKKLLIPKLIGTAGSWFLFDVTFYGNQLYQGDVLEGVFGAAETAKAEAAQHIALEMVGLPGYFVTVALVGSMGPRRIQVQGFAMCAILFALLGLGFEPLKKQPYVLLALYSLTFFFANFGPNSTTFMLPSLTFPDQVRGSLNGVSAAAGKLGAFVGSLLFKAAVTILEGVGPVLVICALFSLAGGALTMAFVHPEDIEPTVPVDDEDANGNDHDYVELAGEEGGGSETSENVSTREWGLSGGFSSTPGAPPQEHTPINGTYLRLESAAQGSQQYGGTSQNAVALASNGVLHGGVQGYNNAVVSKVDGLERQMNPTAAPTSSIIL